jgi:hypothetical protein
MIEVRKLSLTHQLNKRDDSHILCLTKKIIPGELLHLKHCLSTVTISLSECEQGFLQINLIFSPTKSSLMMKTV